MDNAEVFTKFKDALNKIGPSFDIESISLDLSLKDDLGLDSLDVIELLMILEEDFNVEINIEDLIDITTIRDACDVLEKLS